MSKTWLALILVPLSASASAPDFHVEDENLLSPPAAVEKAVVASESTLYTGFDGKPCAYEGRAVDLDGDGTRTDWVLTTKGACSWAASAAPVWLVRDDANGARVVLQFMSFSLTIGTAKSHGLRHVATARATAARTEEQLWKFDGQEYQLTRNRVTTD